MLNEITKLNLNLKLIEATSLDFNLIMNMGRFYEYEMSRYTKWPWQGEDSGYPTKYLVENFKRYFEEKDRYPFLIKVDQEVAGFALIDKKGSDPEVEWNIGEFFILAKFQGQGLGRRVAEEIFNKFHGKWEVACLPDNSGAYKFWKKIVANYSNNNYQEVKKIIQHLNPYEMIVFNFSN
jgi:predicted acetyltransferase